MKKNVTRIFLLVAILMNIFVLSDNIIMSISLTGNHYPKNDIITTNNLSVHPSYKGIYAGNTSTLKNETSFTHNNLTTNISSYTEPGNFVQTASVMYTNALTSNLVVNGVTQIISGSASYGSVLVENGGNLTITSTSVSISTALTVQNNSYLRFTDLLVSGSFTITANSTVTGSLAYSSSQNSYNISYSKASLTSYSSYYPLVNSLTMISSKVTSLQVELDGTATITSSTVSSILDYNGADGAGSLTITNSTVSFTSYSSYYPLINSLTVKLSNITSLQFELYGNTNFINSTINGILDYNGADGAASLTITNSTVSITSSSSFYPLVKSLTVISSKVISLQIELYGSTKITNSNVSGTLDYNAATGAANLNIVGSNISLASYSSYYPLVSSLTVTSSKISSLQIELNGTATIASSAVNGILDYNGADGAGSLTITNSTVSITSSSSFYPLVKSLTVTSSNITSLEIELYDTAIIASSTVSGTLDYNGADGAADLTITNSTVSITSSSSFYPLVSSLTIKSSKVTSLEIELYGTVNIDNSTVSSTLDYNGADGAASLTITNSSVSFTSYSSFYPLVSSLTIISSNISSLQIELDGTANIMFLSSTVTGTIEYGSQFITINSTKSIVTLSGLSNPVIATLEASYSTLTISNFQFSNSLFVQHSILSITNCDLSASTLTNISLLHSSFSITSSIVMSVTASMTIFDSSGQLSNLHIEGPLNIHQSSNISFENCVFNTPTMVISNSVVSFVSTTGSIKSFFGQNNHFSYSNSAVIYNWSIVSKGSSIRAQIGILSGYNGLSVTLVYGVYSLFLSNNHYITMTNNSGMYSAQVAVASDQSYGAEIVVQYQNTQIFSTGINEIIIPQNTNTAAPGFTVFEFLLAVIISPVIIYKKKINIIIKKK